MLSIEKIDGVIWDMDGVLHSYIPFAQSLPHWNGAAVRAFNTVAAASGLNHGLSFEQLHRMAAQSFQDHGASVAVFSRDYGMCQRKMHIEFHREAEMEKLINAHDLLPDLFSRSSHLQHIVLTHGSSDWAQRCLEKHGLRDYFNAVISFEDVDMRKKSECEIPFLTAIEYSGLSADRLAMVEDTKKNLIIPKRLGMQTVFIEESGLEPQWIKKPTPEDKYIDLSVATAPDFLKLLASVPS